MVNIRILAVASLAAAIVLPSYADPATADTAYDVEKVVELVVRENATLKRGAIELGALRRKAENARAFAVPSLSLGAALAKAEDAAGFAGEGSVVASVSVSAASLAAMRQARLAREIGEASRVASVREVELSARKAFYAILYQREYLGYLRMTAETANDQYEFTMERLRAGLIPTIDGLSAKVNLENVRLALGAEENAYESAQSSLKQAMGISLSETFELRGALDDPLAPTIPPESAMTGRSQSHDAARKRLELEFARRAERDARIAVWSPTLSCSVSARSPVRPTQGELESPTIGVSAALTFPIGEALPWSASREAAATAADSVLDLEIQLESLEMSDAARRDSLRRDIERSRKAIETRKLAVSLAEESYRLTIAAFKSGSADFLALKNATDALREAETGMLSERYSLISSILDLEYVCGARFGAPGRIQ